MDVHARTFATWTMLTCVLCIVTAFNLKSAPIYFTTIFSFLLALAHIGTEALVFRTIGPKQLISPGLTAGEIFYSSLFHKRPLSLHQIICVNNFRNESRVEGAAMCD